MDDKSFIRMPKTWVRTALIVVVTAVIVAPLAALASHSFTDVPNTNTFHADIEWLKDSGVTKGCNPPANTLFCPEDEVTREQMSAFMRRLAQYLGAEDGTPAQADNADTLDGKDASVFAARLFAVVEADGSVRAHRGLTSTTGIRLEEGVYKLQFDRDVTSCAVTASHGARNNGFAGNGIISVGKAVTGGDPESTVNIRTQVFIGGDFVDTDEPFDVAVVC